MTHDEKQAIRVAVKVIEENIKDIQRANDEGNKVAIKINTENIRTWLGRISDAVEGR